MYEEKNTVLSLQQGLQSSTLVVCLYMAFLLWFHKPVLHFVATTHIYDTSSFVEKQQQQNFRHRRHFNVRLNIHPPTTQATAQDSEHKEFTVLLYNVCNNKAELHTQEKENVSLVHLFFNCKDFVQTAWVSC